MKITCNAGDTVGRQERDEPESREHGREAHSQRAGEEVVTAQRHRRRHIGDCRCHAHPTESGEGGEQLQHKGRVDCDAEQQCERECAAMMRLSIISW
jgi:hypothetical protein